MEKEKVVLGLSGGVDSAVAALLLARQGFAVHCVYLDNGVSDPSPARETAAALGLPFQVEDIREPLRRKVCRPFYDGYLHGETPSPCALCNPTVKFPALLRVADALAAPWVATGHYARAVPDAHGARQLLRGRPANDQSYLLSRLTAPQLQRIRFPLGEYEKREVRALAEKEGLAVAHRPDSMEICFIPGDDYAAWLDSFGPTPPPGDFVDGQGRILGRHKGIHHYTLGQGSGLGLSGPHKYYVRAIRPETNQVVLSDGSDLWASQVRVRDLNLLALAALDGPVAVTARFRHSKGEVAARLLPGPGGGAVAETQEPVRAPTPGQLAVFYGGDAVLASGWIV